MAKHGVFVTEQGTGITSSPVAVESGIPFFIGAAPVHAANNPAAVGVPVLCTGYKDFADKFGESDDWNAYNLCESAYGHFVLFGMQPAIFVNLLDPSTMKTAVAAADKDVTAKKVALAAEAIPGSVVVKGQGGSGTAYVKDTDYALYFADGVLTVELLPDSTHYTEAKLNIGYDVVTPASVTNTVVTTGLEAVDLCMSKVGVVPDMIVAPGYSQTPAVAAAMTAKAAAINGMFKAQAIVDISTAASGGADTYDEVLALKASSGMTGVNEIVCWPLAKLEDRTFRMSTIAAGRIAQTDSEYGAPYASPSNKAIKISALVDAAGNEINLTFAQANILNAGGVVTALNFMGGFRLWGNYNACYPDNTDMKDCLIPIRRMFNWVAATLIVTFWDQVDEPLNRRLIDSIVDAANIWMNGLTGSGYILGGRVEFVEDENPQSAMMAGIVKLHVYITPPSPAQEIDFVLEYDASYVDAAFGA